MTSLPHTRLLLGPSRSVVLTGPHIQVLDSGNGDLIYSTANLAEEEKQAVLKSGPIRCAAVNASFTHLVTTGDDKKLKVWQIDGLKLLSTRELPKKPTEIAFTLDGQTILVSDKFGDVFSYPLHPKPKAPEEEPRTGTSKRGALTSHENPSDGELVLGHVSLLTTFLLTADEKYIITADRDEHIRVSWYPKGYVIERYCLGHEKFVSTIHIPAFAQDILVSGGGDPTLKLWDWMSGEQIAEVPVLEAIEPYIKVKAPKNRRGWNDGEDDEGGTAENSVARRRKRGRKGRGKSIGAGQKEGSVEGTPAAEDKGVGEGEGDAETTPGPVQSEAGTEETDRTVLVIHKVSSLDLGDHGRYLVFSAIGATALFYCAYPVANASEPPKVYAFNLDYPIIDFTLAPDNSTWVLLDISTTTDTDASEDRPSPVALLSWAPGKPSRVEADDAPALLKSLQSQCTLPATPADLKALDLYAPLSSLPKNVDPEHDPLRRDFLGDIALAEVSTPEPDAAAQGPKKELTMREQARLRKKRALAAKLLEEKNKSGAGPQGQVQVEEGKDERESKRVRSDSEHVEGAGVASAGEAMDES